jgi:hypothetical protein
MGKVPIGKRLFDSSIGAASRRWSHERAGTRTAETFCTVALCRYCANGEMFDWTIGTPKDEFARLNDRWWRRLKEVVEARVKRLERSEFQGLDADKKTVFREKSDQPETFLFNTKQRCSAPASKWAVAPDLQPIL